MSKNHPLIVIGASAGGVEALVRLVRGLPADLPAAVVVVVHVPASATSVLPDILDRAGALPAMHAQTEESLQPGCIYVAPPDRHLLVNDGRLRLSRGPRQNNHRPAIDPLFSTAARAYGRRVIGVVLSGTLDDGMLGLWAIKQRGGLAIVQDPDDALFPEMPRNALNYVAMDYVLPVDQMGEQLAHLARQLTVEPEEKLGGEPMTEEPDTEQREAEWVAQDKAALERGERPGEPTMLTCPDCGGVLWELNEAEQLRYRCHVGHAYSAEGLQAQQSEVLEEALWTAVRSLEESAALARRMAHRSQHAGNSLTAGRFDERAKAYQHRAALVRRALMEDGPLITEPLNPEVPAEVGAESGTLRA